MPASRAASARPTELLACSLPAVSYGDSNCTPALPPLVHEYCLPGACDSRDGCRPTSLHLLPVFQQPPALPFQKLA